MKIVDFIKGHYGRVESTTSRWLVWDDTEWVVYERKPYAKSTKCVIRTEDEEEAVAALEREDG